MKRIVCYTLMTAALLSVWGCLSLSTTVKFQNRSTWAVSVSPNQQTWAPFALQPGQDASVKAEFDAISFIYDPVQYVYFEWADATTIVFRDRATPISGK